MAAMSRLQHTYLSDCFSVFGLITCCFAWQVEFVLEWTSAAGFELSAAARSPQGFTPLHLAALLNDDGRMAVTVTSQGTRYPSVFALSLPV